LPDKTILDITNLEEAFEDDTAGIAELLEMALETGRRLMGELRDAIATGNAPNAARAAHSIKGSAANIGAMAPSALAAALEQRARAGDLEGAADACTAIETAYAPVAAEISAYRAAVS